MPLPVFMDVSSEFPKQSWSTNVAVGLESQLSWIFVTVPVEVVPVLAKQFSSLVSIISAGGVKVGGVVSWTFIVCVYEVLFKHASVAVQVLKIVDEPAQDPVVCVSKKLTVAIPQLSVAVNVWTTGITLHSTVILDGNDSLKVGGVLSITVIVCTKLALVFPQPSLKFQVRTLV